MTERNELKFFLKTITIFLTIILIFFIIYGLKLGLFQNKMILVDYIKEYGVVAPIFFIFFQIIQVIIPIIPGNASCLAGVLAFGPTQGFIYNYLGIIIGSLITFNLSKKYGLEIIKKFFKEETYQKYLKYINDNNFNKLFFFSILLPFFPDDLLNYIAGLSPMDTKKFLTIILVGKPLTLLIYSVFAILF